MAKIQTIKNKDDIVIYPQTHTTAVFTNEGEKLQDKLDQYLTTEDIGELEEVAAIAELQSNKVTEINENSTDTTYPSAKAVYEAIAKNNGAGLNIIIPADGTRPTEGEASAIYLIPAENAETENVYEEWIYINSNWEMIGTTKIDLSNYYTKIEAGEQFAKLSLYGDTTINIGRKANTTIGLNSVAEGIDTTASGHQSHAEGVTTTASGNYSHAEGLSTTASGNGSHAEGYNTTASGMRSHAEGESTTASKDYSHAEGNGTTASGYNSHAEGNHTIASGNSSHAEGHCTQAASDEQHVQGKYNIADSNDTYAHIVGNGTLEAGSNAHTLDWDGNAWFEGDVYVGSTSGTNKDEGSKKLATEEYINNKITYGTTTLEDGVSELATGTLYVVYEE